MTRKIFLYGLIGGAIVSGLMVGTIALMKDSDHGVGGMLYGYATMILAFSSIFFALRSYRNENGGSITFGKSLLIGVGITLIASSIYVATWMAYVSTAGKGFEDKYSAAMQVQMEKDSIAAVGKMVAEGQPAEKIEAKQKAFTKQRQDSKQMMDLYKNNALVKAGFTYMEILPVGLIISLIMAGVFAFLKKPGAQVDTH